MALGLDLRGILDNTLCDYIFDNNLRNVKIPSRDLTTEVDQLPST
jgi:hypothetical protein